MCNKHILLYQGQSVCHSGFGGVPGGTDNLCITLALLSHSHDVKGRKRAGNLQKMKTFGKLSMSHSLTAFAAVHSLASYLVMHAYIFFFFKDHLQ